MDTARLGQIPRLIEFLLRTMGLPDGQSEPRVDPYATAP